VEKGLLPHLFVAGLSPDLSIFLSHESIFTPGLIVDLFYANLIINIKTSYILLSLINPDGPV